MPIHPDARKKIVNAAMRGDALTFPTTYFFRLHTTNLSTVTLPSTLNMVSSVGTGFHTTQSSCRLTTGKLTSATTANSSVVLTTGIQFPDPLTNWSTVYAISLWDSTVSSGAGASTCWYFTNLQTAVNVTAGNPIRLSSGTTLGFSFGLS